MNYEKFNKLATVSMEAKGEYVNSDLVLNLGKNGQVTFSVNEDQPWTFTKVVHTDLGSHPVMHTSEQFEDILNCIAPYIDETTYMDLGPFIEITLFPHLKGVKATANFYQLNLEAACLDTQDVCDVAEIEKVV